MAASAADVEVTVRSTPSSAPGSVVVPPKPPATIAGMERFIALAIRLVRIEPDAPTIMPATIIAVLFSAKPAAAADNPVRALSSEMTTGISAPPIGSTTIRPSTPAAISRPTIHHPPHTPHPPRRNQKPAPPPRPRPPTAGMGAQPDPHRRDDRARQQQQVV